MKKRIIESLADFSKANSEDSQNALLTEVAKATGLGHEEIKKRSEEILKSIIHNYAAFEISTIDGFTHRILRTFARDLGIPMNFEVELDVDQILAEAVDRLISRAGKDEELTRILIEYTLAKTDDDKSWDISRDLFSISKLLVNENHLKAIGLLKTKNIDDFKVFRKKLDSDLRELQSNLKTSAENFFELIAENGIEETDFSGQYVPKHFRKLKDNTAAPNFTAKWAQNIEDGSLYPKKASESAKAAIDSLQPQIAEIFEQTKKAYFRIEFFTEIQKNIVQLSLLNEINKEIEEIKKERNLMLISEFNPKISEQVKDQPAPFIYERLGERYRHYFIDEFQDTSTMQWENLIPLIDHNLAETEIPSGLTIVGDAKQSIYRWRGGRAEQLIDLSNRKKMPFQINAEVVDLPDNYRSGSEVVNFNNEFFSFASSALSFQEYSTLFKNSFQNPKKGDFGHVNISFVEAKNREEEFELYPEKVLEIIQNLDTKGFSRKDICILTRKRSEGVAIAEYLSEHSINVVSSETLLIGQSPKVQFIISILEFSLNPSDDNLKLQVFDGLSDFLGLEEKDLHHIILEQLPKDGRSFFGFLSKYDIDFDLDLLSELSIYEAVEYIIRSFGLVIDSDAYIQFFLDFVFETAQKTSAGLNEFLERWEQKKESLSIVAPETEDAVHIMTIHKSKGLEFPVVIYPFANSDLQDTRTDSLWLDTNDENIPVAYINASQKMLNWNEDSARAYEELLYEKELDTLNVFYVACTRAAQHLYLLANYREKPRNSPNIPDLLVEFLRNKGKWDNELSYSFGDPDSIKLTDSQKNSGVKPEKYYTSATQNKAVNIVTRAGALWDSRQQEAIEKGELAHEILARINSHEDLEPALEWALNSGMITKTSIKEIRTLISGIISHPELKDYFSKEVKNINEQEIITTSGERLRPDRVNFSQDKAVIIDYKTGGFVDTHQRQVSNYANALREMGYQVDKSLLVYTNEPVIIKYV